MTPARYDFLMHDNSNQAHTLTTQELNDGWHWCGDWDGLLIGPDDAELAHCSCFEPDDPRYQLVTAMRAKNVAENHALGAANHLAIQDLGLDNGSHL